MKKVSRQKTTLEGSLTVEASLVMMLVLLVVFSLLALTLWLRDRTVVTCTLHESLYRVADAAQGQLQEGVAEMYAVSGELGDLSLGKERRSVSYTGNAYRFWPGLTLSFVENVRRDICQPVEFLRLYRTAQLLRESGKEEAD